MTLAQLVTETALGELGASVYVLLYVYITDAIYKGTIEILNSE